jgi:hypothetical protein
MKVFDFRLRPARFPFGQALDEGSGLDVVLGCAVLSGAVVGGGVEGATLGSTVGAELGGEMVGVTLESTVGEESVDVVVGATLESTVGAELGSDVTDATLESTVDPMSLSVDGAFVLSVGAGFSA